MSTNKFIGILNGVKTWYTALAVSGGAVDGSKIVMTSSNGRLDSTLMPVGVGASTLSMATSEALVAGDFVNIFDVSGTPNCRKADSSNNRPAMGFVTSAVASGASATVFLSGPNTARSSLTPGSAYFLSTSGNISTAAPTVIGHIIQDMGAAVAVNTIPFDYEPPTVIA